MLYYVIAGTHEVVCDSWERALIAADEARADQTLADVQIKAVPQPRDLLWYGQDMAEQMGQTFKRLREEGGEHA